MADAKTPRVPTLAERVAALGWRLEERPGHGFRLVDAITGTHVAAAWTEVDGYGLTLPDVERIVRAHTP
jgi:hypothetical protein